MKPEEKARIIIDNKLKEAGYILQDFEDFNPTEGEGVVVREFSTSSGPADYIVFINLYRYKNFWSWKVEIF